MTENQPTPHVCQMCERPLDGHWWICVNPTLEATQSGLPTQNARTYALAFTAEQLRTIADEIGQDGNAASVMEYDELAGGLYRAADRLREHAQRFTHYAEEAAR